MKTAHRTASHAKRRWIASPTAWIETIAANADQCPHHATEVTNLVRTAFEVLKSGAGDHKDFDRHGSALNVGLVRAEEIDYRAVEVMQAGIDALSNCDAIQQRHGRYGFAGPDLVALTDAVNLYDDILRLSKPIQMERALNEAARRMLAQGQGVAA